MSALPVNEELPGDHTLLALHPGYVAGQPLDRGPSASDTHGSCAAVEPSALRGRSRTGTQSPHAEEGILAQHVPVTPLDHAPDVAHGQAVGRGDEPSPPADPRAPSSPIEVAGRPEDVVLAITADLLDDLERARIATENRVRSLAQVKGLDGTDVEQRMAGMVEGIKELEHDAEIELQRAMRSHPLGPWVKQAKGVGEKQAGRLLAAVGDPYIHSVTGQPRTVSQLWAYCGYHVLRPGHTSNGAQSWPAGAETSQGGDTGHVTLDAHATHAGVAPSRARGQKANWNAGAKMRAFLVAESCLKQLRKPCVKPEGQAWAEHQAGCSCSPYRVTYDDGRRKYADAEHQAVCKRCGPAGKPAAVGSPLSEGHKHARALRLVAKAVLRDLWVAARDVHESA